MNTNNPLLGFALIALQFLWDNRAEVVVALGLFLLMAIANAANLAASVLWTLNETIRSEYSRRERSSHRDD